MIQVEQNSTDVRILLKDCSQNKPMTSCNISESTDTGKIVNIQHCGNHHGTERSHGIIEHLTLFRIGKDHIKGRLFKDMLNRRFSITKSWHHVSIYVKV